MSPSSSPTGQCPHSELLGALSALHLGGKYSDLTITCNYRQWNVHQAIVCSRSGFFDGACSHAFREANTGVIDLSEDEEEAVEQMIHYLYHLDYLNEQPKQAASAMFRHRAYSDARKNVPKKIDFSQIQDPLLTQAGLCPTTKAAAHIDDSKVPSKTHEYPTTPRSSTPPSHSDDSDDEDEGHDTTESESHLILHTQVYAIAEKYDISSLKQLARGKFEVAIACYYDAPELAEAIEGVYSTTVDSDRGLRSLVLQLFKRHPGLASTQDIYAVIKNTPSLALDLWKVERGLI